MAALTFSEDDVTRLLGLEEPSFVQGLIESGVLRAAAFTPAGRPLFSADGVERAAAELTFAERVASRLRKGRPR